MTTPECLDREHCQLLVIDIQEKLLPRIHDYDGVLAQAELMVLAAVALDLPVTVSEQYPKGLGPTVPPIVNAATGAARVEKTTFSFCADAGCRSRLAAVVRPQVLLIGIEAHVCVLQTAVDLLGMQLRPVVLADAVGSRRLVDCQIALEYLRNAGAVVTTVESAIFQLVRQSGTELFRRILPLVR